MMKRLSVFSLLVVFLSVLTLAAQNKPPLTIRCNVSGAQVYVNGTLTGVATPALMLRLNPGSYQIRVTARGYQDYNSTVNLPPAGMALTVTLQPGASGAPAPQAQPQPAPQPQPQYTPPPQPQYAAPPQPAPQPAPSLVPQPQPQYAPPPQVLGPPTTPPTPTQPAPTGWSYQFARVAQGPKGTSVISSFRSAVWGADKFVVISDKQYFYSDESGQNWTKSTSMEPAYNNKSVLWANGSYLLMHDRESTQISQDGKTWITGPRLSGLHGALLWTGSNYYLGGNFGDGYSSTDGKNWTPFQNGSGKPMNALAFGAGRIVAASDLGTILTSTDGRQWTVVSTGLNEILMSAAYGRPGFVVGGSGPSSASILFSPDGVTWTVVHRTNQDQSLGALIWDGDRFLIGGYRGYALESFDGRTWSPVATGTNQKIVAFASNGDTTILLEMNGGVLSSRTPVKGGKVAAPAAPPELAPPPPPAVHAPPAGGNNGSTIDIAKPAPQPPAPSASGSEPKKLWSYAFPKSADLMSLTLSPAGNAYVWWQKSESEHAISALSPDGVLLWDINLKSLSDRKDGVDAVPVRAPIWNKTTGNLIAAVSGHGVWAFDPSGKLVWRSGNSIIAEALLVRPDGGIVSVGGGQLSFFSPAGKLLSSKEAPMSERLAQFKDGGLASGDYNGWVRRLSATGNLDWESEPHSFGAWEKTVAMTNEGIFVWNAECYRSLDPSGRILWDLAFRDRNIYRQPTVSATGAILFPVNLKEATGGMISSFVYAIDPKNGKTLWTYPADPDAEFTSIVLPTADGGALAITSKTMSDWSSQTKLHRLGADGQAKKVWNLGNFFGNLATYHETTVFSDTGRLYFKRGNSIYCYQLEDRPAAAPWPGAWGGPDHNPVAR